MAGQRGCPSARPQQEAEGWPGALQRQYLRRGRGAAASLALLLTLPLLPLCCYCHPASLLRGLSQNGTSLAERRQLQAAAGSGFWSVSGVNFVDSNGTPVKFSGVTWAGFETPNAVFGGLNVRSYSSHLDQMASLGFNVLRLPFAGDTLSSGTWPAPGTISANPDLQGFNSLQIMDKMVAECSNRGIKVILDYHRMHLTWTNEIGTWWDSSTPEEVWINNWQSLAARFRGNPTIIGADLFNEVHPNGAFPEGAPFWEYDMGDLEPYNFRRASQRAIDAIHAIEPNWIIFMEGMWMGPYWWGGNLNKVLQAPITQPAGKLAYTAHDYGPYVADLPWFHTSDFPDNLVGLYRYNWGFVAEQGIGPLWIGEFGSFYPPANDDFNRIERATFEQQVNYIAQIGASWTIAFWGPDSKDTGGILLGDWNTINSEKYSLLQKIMHYNFA